MKITFAIGSRAIVACALITGCDALCTENVCEPTWAADCRCPGGSMEALPNGTVHCRCGLREKDAGK